MDNTDKYRIEQLEEENRLLKAKLEQIERNHELIVEGKTSELVAKQADLENLSRRQAILIKVLHIMQSTENLQEAMQETLAEIGKYTGVSRVKIFEKSADGTTVSNTIEWCNVGIDSNMKILQNLHVDLAPWFDISDGEERFYTPDDKSLSPEVVELMLENNIKSILISPLISEGVNYGFIDFNDCLINRVWNDGEIEILKSLSQIISGAKQRFQTETSLRKSHQTMHTVLDNITADVIVIDFETMEIVYANQQMKKKGITEGKICWKALQNGKAKCDTCPQKYLLGIDGRPAGVHHMEYFHEPTGRHLLLDVIAIEWIDGRMAQMKIAVDVTDRKLAEQELIMERDRLMSIGNNIPGGSLFRLEIYPKTKKIRYTYLSETWAEITGLDVQRSLDDFTYSFSNILPNDLRKLMKRVYDFENTQNYSAEFQIFHAPSGEIRWLQIATHSNCCDEDHVIYDGFILDVTARKNTETALQKSHQIMRTVLDNITADIVVTDFETMKIIFANENLKKKLPGVELEGKECWKALQIGQSDKCDFCPQKYLLDDNGQPTGIYHWEHFNEALNRHMSWDSVAIEWIDGRLAQMEIGINITDRKYAEQQLLFERDRLQSIGDHFPDGSLFRFEANPQTMEMYISYLGATWEEVLGVSREDTMADISNVFKVVFPEDLPNLMLGIRSSIENFSYFNIEARILYKGVETKWLLLSSHPRKIAEDKLISDGFILDITDRKLAEQELRDERDRVKAIGDNFPDGALYRLEVNPQNMEMNFTYVSGTWVEVMGFTIEETKADISKAFSSVMPDFLESMMEEITKCTLHLEHFLFEYQKKHKENEIRWIQASAHPKKVAEDKVIFDGFVLDITVRKHAEQELRMERDRIKAIGDNFPNGALFRFEKNLKTKKMGFTYLSETWTKVTGLEIQRSLDDVQYGFSNMISDDLQNFISKVNDFGNIETWNTEIRINHTPTGEIRWLHIVSHPRVVNKKEVIYDGFILDVTARKKAEDELAKYSERLEFLVKIRTEELEASNEELQVASEELQATNEELGGSNEELIALNEELDRYKTQLERLVEIKTSELIARQADLEKSHQTMRKVLDSIDANITVYDFDTSVILFANEKIKQGFGEIEGKLCWQTLHQGMTEVCSFCPRPYILNENKQPTGVYRWEYLNDFDKKWYECHDIAIEWIDGRVVHLQQEIDIDDRKHIENELIRAKEKAEEADNLKSAFLANMSHEIRTPINGIVGFLSFIAADNLSPERKQNYINIIKNSATQLVQLIDDIIDVAKIEAKQMTIHLTPVNINELMTELKLFFDTYLHTKNKTHIALILDDSLFVENCTALIDTVRLRQVLNNLMVNAIKYTEKGYIRFGYRQSAPDYLEFVVEDTGIGMAEDQHQIIFERFRQAETKHFHRGTGLGLNIAQSLIQKMGGEIWVKSTEGVGSTFYFTISYTPFLSEDKYFT